jgi:small subunit ribosomal protein S20
LANHKSAAKRTRQNLKRRDRNRQITSRVRGAVKKVHEAIEGGNASDAAGALRGAEKLIRRAASKGALPKTRASRSVARLAKAVHRLS